MRWIVRCILCTTLALPLMTLAPKAYAQQAAPERVAAPKLGKTLDDLLKSKGLEGAIVGVHVVDVDKNQELYAHQADEPVNPASNMKLLTSAAALELLGPSKTWRTEVLASSREGTSVKGLILKGSGESLLQYRHFVSWAAALKRAGVERVEGPLIIDDSAHKGDVLPPGFEQKQEDASYRSAISAVSVNFNGVDVIIKPGAKPGDLAQLEVFPPNSYVKLINEAKTDSGKTVRVGVSAKPSADGAQMIIRVKGKVGITAKTDTWRKRIDDPTRFVGAVFAAALNEVGIKHDGSAKKGAAPAGAEVLASHESEPLSYTVYAMNKWSNNFIAEMLLRELGAIDGQPGTSQAGLERIKQVTTKLGVSAKGLTLYNGSGLYDGNLISARQITQLLVAMSAHRYGADFIASLPIAGEDGSLKNRLGAAATKGVLRAKTGTLNEVSALSGYTRTKGGRMVAFSIILYKTKPRAWTLRDVQDKMATAIAESQE